MIVWKIKSPHPRPIEYVPASGEDYEICYWDYDKTFTVYDYEGNCPKGEDRVPTFTSFQEAADWCEQHLKQTQKKELEWVWHNNDSICGARWDGRSGDRVMYRIMLAKDGTFFFGSSKSVYMPDWTYYPTLAEAKEAAAEHWKTV